MRHRFPLFCVIALTIVAAAESAQASSAAAAETGSNAPPIFEGLGSLQRTITTSSPDAQRYFNQALCFLFAFNHDEAIRSFRKAAELDPSCPMAMWGLALPTALISITLY